MISHACCLSLSVGCCYDYEKPEEPNEQAAAVLRGPAILLMENSVAYSAELCPARSNLKKNLFSEDRSNEHVSIQWLQPSMAASCLLDKLLTAVPGSWFEKVECRLIMLHACYQAAEKGFVLGRQACPATLSQQLSSCFAWEVVTQKEGVIVSNTGPVPGGCLSAAGLKKQVCAHMGTGMERRQSRSGLPASC